MDINKSFKYLIFQFVPLSFCYLTSCPFFPFFSLSFVPCPFMIYPFALCTFSSVLLSFSFIIYTFVLSPFITCFLVPLSSNTSPLSTLTCPSVSFSLHPISHYHLSLFTYHQSLCLSLHLSLCPLPCTFLPLSSVHFSYVFIYILKNFICINI